MIVRRTLEGAEKCALRDFLLEEDRAAADEGQSGRALQIAVRQRIQELILVILSVFGRLSVGESKVAGRHREQANLEALGTQILARCGLRRIVG
jgi:hypothetical protein